MYLYIFSSLVDDIKKLWTKLRENYRKCLKKREQKTRSGAGTGRLPSCNFFNELQFLADTLNNKPTDSNLNLAAVNYDKENTTPDNLTTTDNNNFTRKRTTKRHSDDRLTYQTQQQPQPNMLDVAIVETLRASKKEEEPKEKDSNVLFCLSLVDTLKSLSPRNNAFAKLKIQQILFEIEHGDV